MLIIPRRGLISPVQDTLVASPTQSAVATLAITGALVGDLIVGFTMNSASGQRPISNSGATVIGNNNSATSSGCAGWFFADAADDDLTCSGGNATRLQGICFRGAKTIFGGTLATATNTTLTFPELKGPYHGGMYFLSIMSETAGLTISSDDTGLPTPSTNTSGASRHRWQGLKSMSSYPGGSVTLSGSGEWWIVYGIAI